MNEEIKLSPKITNNGNEISLNTIAFYQGKEYNLQDLLNNLLNLLQKKDNIIDKAIEYIEQELLPSHSIEKTEWEFEEVIFSDLPVERIKPLIDILRGDKE